jgi:tetratricopeptide (TPR) repeat protein
LGGFALGKSSKKVVKKQQQMKAGEQQMKIDELKEKIAKCKEDGKYEDALEDVIALLQMHCYDIDVIFDAAELYFMAGDYQRAAVWINKTLEFDSSHLGARILLTRICMLGDRPKDGLDIMEFVLKNGKDRITEEQNGQIEEILEYYRYTSDLDKIRERHPNVAGFLGLTLDGIEKSAVEENVVVKKETDRKMNLLVGDAQNIKDEIMQKEVSLQEKIKLFNSFAGAYFYDDKLLVAKDLLFSALEIDAENTETLRNIIILLMKENDKESALKYITKLKKTDFSLLDMIKKFDS